MRRKYEALDVVKMRATLTLEHWESCLRKAAKSGNINKLVAWRYGLQAGMSDAAKKGLNDDELVFWVIKRCRDLEKVARHILKKKHHNPLDIVSKTHKGRRFDYAMKAKEAKKLRDREFEIFLQRSSF